MDSSIVRTARIQPGAKTSVQGEKVGKGVYTRVDAVERREEMDVNVPLTELKLAYWFLHLIVHHVVSRSRSNL